MKAPLVIYQSVSCPLVAALGHWRHLNKIKPSRICQEACRLMTVPESSARPPPAPSSVPARWRSLPQRPGASGQSTGPSSPPGSGRSGSPGDGDTTVFFCIMESYRKEDSQVYSEGHPADGVVLTAVLTVLLLVFETRGDDVEDPGNSWTVVSGSWGTWQVTKDDEEPDDDGGLLPSLVESLLDWHLVPGNIIYDPLIKGWLSYETQKSLSHLSTGRDIII